MVECQSHNALLFLAGCLSSKKQFNFTEDTPIAMSAKREPSIKTFEYKSFLPRFSLSGIEYVQKSHVSYFGRNHRFGVPMNIGVSQQRWLLRVYFVGFLRFVSKNSDTHSTGVIWNRHVW